jgi:hypothetical protein
MRVSTVLRVVAAGATALLLYASYQAFFAAQPAPEEPPRSVAEGLVRSARVVVFSKSYCPYRRALAP